VPDTGHNDFWNVFDFKIWCEMINLKNLSGQEFIAVKRNIVKVKPGFISNENGSVVYYSDGSYQHVSTSIDEFKFLVKLTDKQSGLPVLINTSRIIKIERHPASTVFYFTDKTIEVVAETIDTIVLP